jgi:hypothetical protein
VLKKTDPTVAKNPLIFPTKKMLSNVHQFDAAAAQNDKFKTQFAQLTGS